MSRYLIVGVQHTDARNTDRIDALVEGPIAEVFHELPPEPRRRDINLWKLTAPTRTLVQTAGLSDPAPRSECERAAMALADRAGTDVVYVGMPPRLRWRRNLRGKFFVEWLLILALLVGGYHFLQTFLTSGGVPIRIHFAMILLSQFGAVMLSGIAFTKLYNERRDDWMADKIAATDIPEGKVGVMITGEDHVSGIGGRLQARGHDVDAIWLRSYLKDESD